jgi:hypothetical protein
MKRSRTPLTPSEQATLDRLKEHPYLSSGQEEVTRADVVSYLVGEGIERADAVDHVEQLLLKGYLYEVDSDLRIPPEPR